MTNIGLLSDTHGYIDDKLINFFKNTDEIWHAGDIGNLDVIEKLEKIKPLKAVFGNIDGHDIRIITKEKLRFMCENVDVLMTHIGGYPGKYAKEIFSEINLNPPKLFISGHSHILKVMFDKKLNLLHINPGAAGKYGLHVLRTAMRFTIENDDIKNLEILEINK